MKQEIAPIQKEISQDEYTSLIKQGLLRFGNNVANMAKTDEMTVKALAFINATIEDTKQQDKIKKIIQYVAQNQGKKLSMGKVLAMLV